MKAPNRYDNSPLLYVEKDSLESTLIEGETLAYGLISVRFNTRVFTAQDKQGVKLGFRRAASSATSVPASEICADKAAAKIMMAMDGVPTAPGQRMPRHGVRSASRFAETHGWPVVVKPLRGSGGKGITAGISSREELYAAAEKADSRAGFLIEKHVPGDDYRFLVIGGVVAGVWTREAAHVLGDGKSSITELVGQKNVLRLNNPHLSVRPILKDAVTEDFLRRSGRTLKTIPDRSEKVYLRSVGNLSSGGDNIDVTDSVHPTLQDIAVKASTSLPGAELVGVDMLLEDHSLPADVQDVNVCELNGQPGVSAHEFPMYGVPRACARGYIERLSLVQDIELSSYRPHGRYRLSVQGRFNERRYRAYMDECLEHVSAAADGISVTRDHVTFEMESSSRAAAAMCSNLVKGMSSRVGVPEACRAERME